METKEKSLGIYLILVFAITVIGSLFCSLTVASVPQDLPGTWNVAAELVAATSENPYDPNAPKPGMIKPDAGSSRIKIAVRFSQAAVAQFRANTQITARYFDGTYPLGSGVYMVVHIECFWTAPLPCMEPMKMIIGERIQ